MIHSLSLIRECPSGWKIYNNLFCHKVVVAPSNAFVAQQVCRSLGGYLADPIDINEYNAIKNGVVQSAWNIWGAQNVWVRKYYFYFIKNTKLKYFLHL